MLLRPFGFIHVGFRIFLNTIIVLWSANEQNTVAFSSTEAKYRVVAHYIIENHLDSSFYGVFL